MGLSEFLRKTFVSQTSRVHEAGQAVIEYILVLVITLAIILGMMYQFNDAFKQFLDSYFGDYIACLLETGELPSLGGSGANQGQCQSPFANFDITAGTSKYNSSGGSEGRDSSSGSSGSSSDSDSGGDRGSSSRNLSPGRVSRSGGTANAEFAGSQGSRNNRPSSQRLRSGADATKSGGFDSSSSEGGGRNGSGRTVRTRRVIFLGDSYLSDEAKKKKGNSVIGKGKAQKKSGAGRNLRKPSFALEVPKGKTLAPDDGRTGFNFGAMIKFLLIAAILIAVFLFLGGQALQIKKSWQKSE